MITQPEHVNGRLNGIPIYITGRHPRMQLGSGSHLAAGDFVTTAYRAEIDAWLAEFFGHEELVANGQIYRSTAPDGLYMNRWTFDRLPAMVRANNAGRARQEFDL